MKNKYPQRHPRVSFSLIPQPENLDFMPDKSQFLIDKALVARKWQALEKCTNRIIPPSYDATHGQSFSVNEFFDHFEGVSVVVPFAITACFHGSQGDGHLQFLTGTEEQKKNMLEGLEVKPSLSGFIESLYLAFHLPTVRAFGHGLYGRNYTLLTSFHVLRHLWRSQFLPEYFKGKVDRPSGIRVAKRREKFYVSCLAVYDFGSIVDFTVRIAEGKAIALWPPDIIFESETRIIY